MRAGFVGLGRMGSPMAVRLAGRPGGLLVYDVRPGACAPAVERGARAVADPLKALAQAVRHSDAVTGGPGAIMLRKTTEPVTPDDPWYEILLHVRTLGEKDLSLALELARASGVETPMAALALERLADGLGVPHERPRGRDHS
ncbi:NAD(P)-binding domain-containing protein [Streptosporangium sp. DT93]|uniref:NAD(P)-binding domain-containing protein n=1 Tax=Streptosporangium sp. DT93 TaxID=3393428 RepID=UPI003CEF91C7